LIEEIQVLGSKEYCFNSVSGGVPVEDIEKFPNITSKS